MTNEELCESKQGLIYDSDEFYEAVDEIVDKIGVVSFVNGEGYLPGHGYLTPEELPYIERDMLMDELGITKEQANEVMVNYLGFKEYEIADDPHYPEDEDQEVYFWIEYGDNPRRLSKTENLTLDEVTELFDGYVENYLIAEVRSSDDDESARNYF